MQYELSVLGYGLSIDAKSHFVPVHLGEAFLVRTFKLIFH